MTENDWSSRALEWAWEKRDWIAEKLKELRSWIWPASSPGTTSRVLILGSGGTGKTTLAGILSGELDTFGQPMYNESIGVEEYKLKDDERTEIIVPPGQLHRREMTWTELQAEIASGEISGVVLVQSYGYHSLGNLSFKEHRLYQGDEKKFLKAFTADRRADELAILNQLVPFALAAPGKFWLATLVVKQDLWWREKGKVERYYRQGSYGKQADDLARQRGPRPFRHEFIFASLVISNFVTGIGELLKTTTAGYDHPLQVQSLRRMFEVFDALREWESANE